MIFVRSMNGCWFGLNDLILLLLKLNQEKTMFFWNAALLVVPVLFGSTFSSSLLTLIPFAFTLLRNLVTLSRTLNLLGRCNFDRCDGLVDDR